MTVNRLKFKSELRKCIKVQSMVLRRIGATKKIKHISKSLTNRRSAGSEACFTLQQEDENAEELVDGWKSEVFKDRVYVLTPQGDIIDLPAGSTPIDFAYHVHTVVGHRCRGAKINGKLVSLDYVLETGNQVEILTAKRGGPSRDWLNPNLGLVRTSRARSKIKQWFKKQDRDSNLTQGKVMLEKEFKRLGLRDIDLEEILPDLNIKTVNDLYVAVGCGDIGVNKSGQ